MMHAGTPQFNNSKIEMALNLTNRFEVPEDDDSSVKTLFLKFVFIVNENLKDCFQRFH